MNNNVGMAIVERINTRLFQSAKHNFTLPRAVAYVSATDNAED